MVSDACDTSHLSHPVDTGKPFLLTYPFSTQPCVYHDVITERINNYAKSGNIMHTLFYGPECSGKLAMGRRLITLHTGVDVQRVKRITHEFKTKDKSFPFFKSSVHFELDVNDFGQSNQKSMIDLIEELSRTLNVSRNTYKIILLRHTEKLTKSIQHQLRRMMELFYATTRLIMLASSLDRIDVTIQSRLVCIRMSMIGGKTECGQKANPTVPQMKEWLRALMSDRDCIDVLTECTRQLWRVLSKAEKLGVTTLRKWVRVIQFTQIPATSVIAVLYSKACAKFSQDYVIQKKLVSVINYYLYMQDVGYRKDFQLEMILFSLYISIHHRDLFDTIVERQRMEQH